MGNRKICQPQSPPSDSTEVGDLHVKLTLDTELAREILANQATIITRLDTLTEKLTQQAEQTQRAKTRTMHDKPGSK